MIEETTHARYIEKESYQHRFAKETLREWIIGNKKLNDDYLNCKIA